MTQINGMSGVENLAASSVCKVGKTFVNENANEDVIYLYTYEEAKPIAVTFTVSEDNAVSATGVFVMYEGFTCDSMEDNLIISAHTEIFMDFVDRRCRIRTENKNQ